MWSMHKKEDSTVKGRRTCEYHFVGSDGISMHRLPFIEISKGGYENILVVTDHLSRYAQAFTTRHQKAQTTA